MGGGSSRITWPKDTKPKDLMTGAVSESERISYEAEINAFLQTLLADFNDRDIDAIRIHLETILEALKKEEIVTIISLLYGGSISKHTYVDGLSDVDVLAVLDKSELEGKTPDEILDYFRTRLQERLPLTEIVKGKLAITVRFQDGHEIQILPALRTTTGIRIAHEDGDRWSNVIKPHKFAEKLTSVNAQNNQGVVPVIKLYKALNSQLPKDVKLSGYHIESLAIEAFKNYEGPKTRKAMIMHFTEYASTAVLKPIKDSTGQSVHVDDYLGEPTSLERQKVSAAIKRISSRMKVADNESSLEKWKDLMGE